MAMSRFIALICCLVCMLPTLSNAQALREDAPTEGITVLAATSLTEVMTELSLKYSAQNNITVHTVFGPPDQLSELVMNGESGDLYIAEDKTQIDYLKQLGLVDVFRQTVLARNSLVFAVRKNNRLIQHFPSNPDALTVLKGLEGRTLWVTADPKTQPLGKASMEALESQGVWETLSKTLVRTASAKEAQFFVAEGEGAGILYASDTHNTPHIVALSPIPSAWHTPIIYHAAVIAGESMTPSREFLNYLKSEDAQKIFQAHGFGAI